MAEENSKEKTETTNAVPVGADASTLNNLTMAFRIWADSIRTNFDVCVPAVVESYDRESHKAKVRPALKRMAVKSGELFDPAARVVTVMRFQVGGFLIDAPLFKGDTGWLVASDRNASSAKAANDKIMDAHSMDKDEPSKVKNKGTVPIVNGSLETHTLRHGFFIPDKWGSVSIPADQTDSLIIQQITRDGYSHGRGVLDPDGMLRWYATRWYDEKEGDPTKRVKGGKILVDLEFKYLDKDLGVDVYGVGDTILKSNVDLSGDARVREWTDEKGGRHGGNLRVDNVVTVGGDDDDSTVRRAVIDPKGDLVETDAKFREVTVVVGLDHDRDDSNKVALKTKKVRILADEQRDTDSVEFDVGGGGGSGSSGKGCWEIVPNPSEPESGGQFVNRFVRVGAAMVYVSDFDETPASLLIDEAETTYFGIKVSAGSEDGDSATSSDFTYEPFTTSDEQDFVSNSYDSTFTLIPLYAFDEDANVVIDFRNIPTTQMFELLGGA